MRVRVPGSSANLGPGLDVLALALDVNVEVSVQPARRLEVTTSGEGRHLPADGTHLAVRVATGVAGHDRLRIEVHSDIPLGRGLGSSAAVAVAAASAAGAGAEEAFGWGSRIDGHPENAAASAFGGLVVATTVQGRPLWRRLPLDPELVFVALVPDRQLLTKDARAVLASTVSREDAVFNLGRLGLLLPGLADHTQLVPEAGDDRLHQDARTALFPESRPLLRGVRDAGALTSFWSGAGTTLLAVVTRAAAPAVELAGAALMAEQRVPGRAMVLEAAPGGITPLGSPGQ